MASQAPSRHVSPAHLSDARVESQFSQFSSQQSSKSVNKPGGEENSAPRYKVAQNKFGAVEHPMMIKDVDKAIQSFGRNPNWPAFLDSRSAQISVPLYLRYDNPTVRPVLSHNAATHNIVLKITVPKRTGRKRKRGSDGPFEGDVRTTTGAFGPDEICSRSMLDEPKLLRQKLAENVGKYTVEAVGVIKNTHRYRGLADFQWDVGNSNLTRQVSANLLSGDVRKFRQIRLEKGIDEGQDVDVLPPPFFTPMNLSFQYGYNQNPYVKEIQAPPVDSEGEGTEEEYDRVANFSSKTFPSIGHFIAFDHEPVPTGPRQPPDTLDAEMTAVLAEFRAAMELRPVWTRRSIFNHIASKFKGIPKTGAVIKYCLSYVGYQFKGGPWRDALVKYGVDPRKDPKYAQYQTLLFKLTKMGAGGVGRPWQSVRRNELGIQGDTLGYFQRQVKKGESTSSEESVRRGHVFDGTYYDAESKVWQVCDVTDPLLHGLFQQAALNSECDIEVSGWYDGVLWSVAKVMMRAKLVALKFGRQLPPTAFALALNSFYQEPEPDGEDGGEKTAKAKTGACVALGPSLCIDVPELQLTADEMTQVRGKNIKPGVTGQRDKRGDWSRETHFRVRLPLKPRQKEQGERVVQMVMELQPPRDFDPALFRRSIAHRRRVPRQSRDRQAAAVPSGSAETDKGQHLARPDSEEQPEGGGAEEDGAEEDYVELYQDDQEPAEEESEDGDDSDDFAGENKARDYLSSGDGTDEDYESSGDEGPGESSVEEEPQSQADTVDLLERICQAQAREEEEDDGQDYSDGGDDEGFSMEY